MFLIFDGTFNGLLSAVAYCLRSGMQPAGIISDQEETPLLEHMEVPCESNIHRLFRRYMRERLGQTAGDTVLDTAYRAFLSEMQGIADPIHRYLALAIQLRQDPASRIYERPVAVVVQTAQKVSGQVHKYLGLLRFREIRPEILLADFEPDYHLLPLLLPHFCDRFANQNFIIRDLRRHLAACHGADGRTRIHLLEDASPATETGGLQVDFPLAGSEPEYSLMWKQYLKRLSIPERRNLPLQQHFIPKKYWKYLVEKPGEDE